MERSRSHVRMPEPGPRRQAPSFQPLTLRGAGGELACRYYALPGATAAAVWVGTAGDWDSPAQRLYPRLADALREEGIAASLRVSLRRPRDPAQNVADLRAALDYLGGQGMRRLALIGHGRGAVAAVQAAVGVRAVRTVVALAPDGDASAVVERLGPRCSLLLLHGSADRVVTPSAASLLYELAREPKDIVLYAGAGHALDEAADAARRRVREWLRGELAA